MGASNFFQNLRPLSQYQTPRRKHDRRDDHDPKEGWMFSQNTASHHKASRTRNEQSVERLDKKPGLSTSIEKKQGPKSRTPKSTGGKST